MKTETNVYAHIVTGNNYCDLVERIETNFWTGEHVKTSWELFGQIDGNILGAEYRDLTKAQAVEKFKMVKAYMIGCFEIEIDAL